MNRLYQTKEGIFLNVQQSRQKPLSLFRLTWPIFLELFLFMCMGLVDTFMLSAVSDDAVAGVGAANQYIQIAILILGVVATGASIVVSQYLGSKMIREASQIAALSVTLNLVVGFVVSGLFVIFSNAIMRMMNLEGAVLEHAQSYLAIVGGFIFLQAVITSVSSIIRVQGWTKQAMYVSLGMNILHLILNYLLIFGTFGFPELGVEGAAISSVVSRAVAMVVFVWLLYQALEARIERHYYFTFSKTYIGEILKIGIPSALEQVLYQVCQVVFLYYVTYLGAESLAARQYATNVSMFAYLFALAIGMSTAILIGRHVGAGEPEVAYHRVWFSLKSALVFTLVMVAFITIFRESLIRLFTDNPEIIQIASSVLLLSILLETGRTFNITIINALRASGDASFPVKIGFISMVCISLPLGYLFVFVLDMGLIGVWLAISVDEWIRAILVMFRWKSRKWQQYAIVAKK